MVSKATEAVEYVSIFREAFSDVFTTIEEGLPYGAFDEAIDYLKENGHIDSDMTNELDRLSSNLNAASDAFNEALGQLWEELEKLDNAK